MFTVGQLRKRLASYPDDALILTLGDLFSSSTVQAAQAAYTSRSSAPKTTVRPRTPVRTVPYKKHTEYINGYRLREKRIQASLSQAKLAVLLGNTGYQTLISFIETRRSKKINKELLAKLPSILNCTLEELTQENK